MSADDCFMTTSSLKDELSPSICTGSPGTSRPYNYCMQGSQSPRNRPDWSSIIYIYTSALAQRGSLVRFLLMGVASQERVTPTNNDMTSPNANADTHADSANDSNPLTRKTRHFYSAETFTLIINLFATFEQFETVSRYSTHAIISMELPELGNYCTVSSCKRLGMSTIIK